jgi:hypothetical protein
MGRRAFSDRAGVLALVVACALAWPAASAHGQAGPNAGTPPAPPPAASDGAAVVIAPPAPPAPAATPGLPGVPEIPRTETFIALPPKPEGQEAKQARAKPLKTTVGIAPTASDLGNETDTGTGADSAGVDVLQKGSWYLNIRGYIRAPLRIGLGPTDASSPLSPTGLELHSPPRMVGFSSSNWAYIAIAPNSSASIRTTITNPRVSGTLILTTSSLDVAGYNNLDSRGGASQAYVTVKFPETFGSRGGLAWTVGSFSNSYGTAGPRQTNTGFYGTYLFGRIHNVGEDLTASIDLNDHVELLLEHGFGARLELLPVLGMALPKQMFTPGDPKQNLGSNFIHHAHAGLRVDDWLKIGAHYLTSWTPDDRDTLPPKEGRLSSTGADVHVDHERWGSFYIGYSHVWGHNLFPLDEALQVIHGGRGYDFKLQYFGNKLRQYSGSGSYLPNDGGRVETVLFQWTLRSYELFGSSFRHFNASLSEYAMFSHAVSAPIQPDGMLMISSGPTLRGPFAIDDNKLKFGAMLELALHRHVSFNARADHVRPTSSDPEQNYTALTGQLVFRSDWRSNRQIIFGYTRFFLGAHDYPDSPYSALYKIADSNLFVASAIMSL